MAPTVCRLSPSATFRLASPLAVLLVGLAGPAWSQVAPPMNAEPSVPVVTASPAVPVQAPTPDAPPALPPAGVGAVPAPAAAAPQPVSPAVPLPAPAVEQARVLSVTSVVQQTLLPQTLCTDAAVQGGAATGAGAVVGAIAGATLGSALGGGVGNALATGAGLVGGAIVGNQIESDGRAVTARQCVTQQSVVPVTTYVVVYEFAGRQYTTHMAQAPGATIPVQVVPAAGSIPQVAAVGVAPAAPKVVMPTAVVTERWIVPRSPSVYFSVGVPVHRHWRHGYGRRWH